MADNTSGSNKDWQKWLEEQGLHEVPSSAEGADTARAEVAETAVLQAAEPKAEGTVEPAGLHSAATGHGASVWQADQEHTYDQRTSPLPGAEQANRQEHMSQPAFAEQPTAVHAPAKTPSVQQTYAPAAQDAAAPQGAGVPGATGIQSTPGAAGIQGVSNAQSGAGSQHNQGNYTRQQAYDQAYQQASAVRHPAGYQGTGHQGVAGQQTRATGQPSAPRAASAGAKKSGGGFKTFALGFLGAALAFALGAGILGATGFLNRQSAVTETVSEGGTVVLGSETNTEVTAPDNHTETLAEAVADKVLPSVVGIDVYASNSGGYGNFWGAGSTESEALAGLGSGVVISEDGYILTNYHVVEGATKLMATVGGEEREATVVGTDESSDLAVIKVEAEDLTPVEIGSSADLRPGQWVMTLGSPFGLEQSVATGIISAVSRTVVIQNSNSLYSYGQQVQPSIYSNMIQTDAAINPGNSGGALVDENGKLIGINSVIESYSGSYSGVGFAIPVDYAMNIATQIIDGKTPTHAQIGISCTTVTKDLADRYSLGATSGAYINKVYENSGAQAAGLEQGDIITKVAGVAVESSTDLIGQVRAHNVGETVTVTFVRGTETKEAEVNLGSDEDAASYTEEGEGGQNLSDPGNGYNNGNGQDGGQGFSYEELEELFNYFNQRR